MELEAGIMGFNATTREVTGNNSSRFMVKPKNGQDYEAETLSNIGIS